MNCVVIKENAVFVADAHLMPQSDIGGLIEKLRKLAMQPGAGVLGTSGESGNRNMASAAGRAESGNKSTPAPAQVILLGDIFAALFGSVESSKRAYLEHIKQLDAFAAELGANRLKIFEGNHDFALRGVFQRAQIHDRLINQAIFESKYFKSHIFENIFKSVSRFPERTPRWRILRARGFIQHGDVFLPPFTQTALRLLRHSWFLALANALDVRGWIFAKILRAQENKLAYKKLNNFAQITRERMSQLAKVCTPNHPACGVVIEGHFHQGECFYENDYSYINLSAYSHTKALYTLQISGKIALTQSL